MIKISKMTDYAVVILHAMDRMSAHGVVASSSIAHETDLSETTVAKVLKLLVKAGLIASSRGIAGGYRLTHPLSALSVAAVIEAIDGPISLTSCVDAANTSCGINSTCAMRGRWNGVNEEIRKSLLGVSLKDMITYTSSPAKAGAFLSSRSPLSRGKQQTESQRA